MFKLSDIMLSNCLFLLTNPDAVSNWSSASKMLGQFFFLVLGFIIIIILIAYSLKLASKFKTISGFNNNMHVIETKALGFNNFVHLVKVSDKYILIGTSKTTISFLTEVDKEKIVDNFDNPTNSKFDEILAIGLKKINAKKKKQ